MQWQDDRVTSQEESSHQSLAMLAPWWSSGFQNSENINLLLLKPLRLLSFVVSAGADRFYLRRPVSESRSVISLKFIERLTKGSGRIETIHDAGEVAVGQ